jgi:hypothetical protein
MQDDWPISNEQKARNDSVSGDIEPWLILANQDHRRKKGKVEWPNTQRPSDVKVTYIHTPGYILFNQKQRRNQVGAEEEKQTYAKI